MRLGNNPQKDKKIESFDYFHQVIIPVYIPYLTEYFKDSLGILKISLNSLFKTVHSQTFITIVNNGSCEQVTNYLDDIFKSRKIHELIHVNQIGKKNSIAKGLVEHNFKYITTADSDVLFLNDWQKKTYEVFKVFPKAGAVSPAPNARHFKYLTANLLWDNLFSARLSFRKNNAVQGMKMFAKSINNEQLFNEVHLKKCFSLKSNNVIAVVGAGHFIVTYRSDAVDFQALKHSEFAMGGDSEFILDEMVFRKGFWRVSTEENYALHLGNTQEDWMVEILESLQNENKISEISCFTKKLKINRFKRFLIQKLFSKIIFQKSIMKQFFILKGLTKDEANKY